MSQQLQIPLFPDGTFEKIKAAFSAREIIKLQKDLAHEKHVKAGYMGALAKEKKTETMENKQQKIIVVGSGEITVRQLEKFMEQFAKCGILLDANQADELSKLMDKATAAGAPVSVPELANIMNSSFVSEPMIIEPVKLTRMEPPTLFYDKSKFANPGGPLGAVTKKRKY